MLEQASLAIGTKQSFIECRACLGLVLVIIYWGCFAHEFVLSVSKLALRSVAAETDLDPIFAHLCFVLSLINFKLLLLLLLNSLRC